MDESEDCGYCSGEGDHGEPAPPGSAQLECQDHGSCGQQERGAEAGHDSPGRTWDMT